MIYIEKLFQNKTFLRKSKNSVERIYDMTVNMTRSFKKETWKIMKEMIFGIMQVKDISLSEIGRYSYKNKIGTKLKHIVASYSKFLLNKKAINRYMEKYIHKTTKLISKWVDKIYIAIDGWDIVKEHSKSRNIWHVHDGSSWEIKRWYVMETAVAFNSKLESIPLLWKFYTRKKNYKSDNNVVRKVIKTLKKAISKRLKVVYLFDRWYDSKAFFEFLSSLWIKFIIKMRTNRYVKVKWKTVQIGDAYTKLRSLRSKVKIILKGWTETTGRLYYWQIRIFDWNERRKYRLVVIKNNKWNHMLLTNEKISNKEEAMEVIKAYSYRRLIEETYKYMKQRYKLEYMHIRDIKEDQDKQIIRMNNLYNLLLSAIWLSMLWLEIIWESNKELLLEVRAIDYMWYKLRNPIWWWLDVLEKIIRNWRFLQNRYQRYWLKHQENLLFSPI